MQLQGLRHESAYWYHATGTLMATGGPTNDIYEVEELEAWLQNNEMFLRACVVVDGGGGVLW